MEHDDIDVKRLLKENTELARQNNKLLKEMKRMALWGTILKVVWFAVLIGVPVFLYFYAIEPYIESFRQSYEGFRAEFSGFSNFRGIEDLFRNME